MIKEVCSNLWNKCNDLTQEIIEIKSQYSIKTEENQLYLSEKEIKIQELNQFLKNQSEELKVKDINHTKDINLIISNNNQERILMKEKIETMEHQIQQLENYNIMKKKTKEEEEIKTLQKKLDNDKSDLNTIKTEILDLKKAIHEIQEENQKIKLAQESSNMEDDILKMNISVMKNYNELKNDIEIMKSNFVIQNNKTLKMIKTNTNNIIEDHHRFKDLLNKSNAQIEISLDKYQQLQTSLTKQNNEEKNEINKNTYMMKQKIYEFEDALQINRRNLNETLSMKLNDLNSINEEKFTYIDEKLTKSISFVKDSFDEMNIKLNNIELNQKNLNDIHINEKLQHELISFKDDMEQLKETFHQTFNSLSNEISTQDNKIERIKQNTELEHWKLTGNIKEQIEAYIKRSSDCVYKRLTDLIDNRITESKEQIQIHIDSLRREIVTDLRKAENNNLINSLNKEKISMEEVMKCTLIKQLKNNSIILHINDRHETLIDKVNEMEQNLHDKIQRQEDKCVNQLRINSQRLELNQSAFEKEIRNYIV